MEATPSKPVAHRTEPSAYLERLALRAGLNGLELGAGVLGCPAHKRDIDLGWCWDTGDRELSRYERDEHTSLFAFTPKPSQMLRCSPHSAERCAWAPPSARSA